MSASTWQPGAVDLGSAASRGRRGMVAVLRGYMRPFVVSVAAGVANQGLQVAAGALAAWIVGAAVTGSEAGELLPWVAVLAVVVLARALAAWLEAWLSHELAFRVLAEVRHWVFRAFERIAPGGVARRRSGDLVARAMADSEGMEMFYAHTLIYVVVAAVLPPIVLVALALVAPLVALVVLPFVLGAGIVPLKLRAIARRQGDELRKATAAVNTEVIDGVQGLREVVSFGQGPARLAAVDAGSSRLATAQIRQGRRAGGEAASANVFLAGGILAALIVGAGLVHDGDLPRAWFPVAIVLAGGAFAPILTLLGATRLWGVTTAAADRVFELLEEPAPVADDGTGTTEDVVPTDGDRGGIEVRFEDVTFTYDDNSAPALDGVSFAVAPGETVALVGHSGAGKSTCAHLLARFWDPAAGRITVGGHDVRDLRLDALRRLVAYVPQDTYLFHESVADNLRLGAPSAADDDLRAAAADAQARTFVEQLPDGFDTVVGERGARLSGGERQRIAIARALLRDSPVLVLDESVSMLDALSERDLRVAVAQARQGRTAVVIAHRLSTIRAADRVVLLERGRVVATGTHDELLATSATYRSLIDAQTLAAP